MDFESLIKSRHSAVNFQKDFKMKESDFEDIMNLTKLAPSTFNLQPTKYLVVLDDDLKEKIYECSYKQYKIHSSSAVVFVLADRNSFSLDNAEKIYGPMKMLKMIDEEQYNSLMEMIKGFVDPLNNDTSGNSMLKELHLSSAINSAFFMLSAKSLGFDTCPMHVVNKDFVSELLNVPSNMEPIMMITVGKSVDTKRQRGYRKRNGEIITFNKFN